MNFTPTAPLARRLLLALFLLVAISSTKAVETVTNGTSTFNTNDTISSTLPSWTNGWGAGNTNDGWNYVGSIVNGGASGVYLGNGWVLTAGHVGPLGPFTLNGNVYDLTGVSYSNFTNSSTGTNNADLRLLQISTTSTTGTNISLPPLTLTATAPSTGNTVVMIGYGGASGFGPESWGTNSVFFTNQPLSVNSFQSIDFTTFNAGLSYGTLVLGDSGGGDFINVSGTWELAGLNEATVNYTPSGTGSAFVQLSAYATQIQTIIAVPEPGTWAMMILGTVALLGSSLWRNRPRDS